MSANLPLSRYGRVARDSHPIREELGERTIYALNTIVEATQRQFAVARSLLRIVLASITCARKNKLDRSNHIREGDLFAPSPRPVLRTVRAAGGLAIPDFRHDRNEPDGR